jgi:AraC-like DNA-binding protein
VLIYWIGYKVLFLPEIFKLSTVTIVKQDAIEDTRYETFLIDESSANNLESKIREAMESDRLFLNPELSLSQLAEHIGSSRHHISQVLNVHMATNFYDFINKYRVDEFIRKLDEPGNESYTLLALAHESGFNSKATFNSVFKKNMGMTPSMFFRNMKQSAVISPN